MFRSFWLCYHKVAITIIIIIRTNLLTYSLRGAGYYLKSWLPLSLSKNLTSLWNPKFHYRVYKSPPLEPMLIQPNPVGTIDPYLPKVQLNVILPPTPRSSQWSLAFRPPNQNPVNTSPFPHVCHLSRPHHPPWFNQPNNIRWKIQAVKFIIYYLNIFFSKFYSLN
jgi:hypothetical protein